MVPPRNDAIADAGHEPVVQLDTAVADRAHSHALGVCHGVDVPHRPVVGSQKHGHPARSTGGQVTAERGVEHLLASPADERTVRVVGV